METLQQNTAENIKAFKTTIDWLKKDVTVVEFPFKDKNNFNEKLLTALLTKFGNLIKVVFPNMY